LKLKHADFLVLDETDRMLDAGFTVQIEKVMTFLAPQRQTLLFSATVAPNIARIAEKYLNDPVRVSVSKSSTPAPNIKQDTIKVSDGEKYTSLLTSLDERDGSIIVFVKTKRGTEKMAKRLQKEGHSAEAIHGDLKQSKRDRVIASFRKMKYRILVATDVAARGLDIPHIEHVINYDLPQCAEDYVHRIGRTARAGATGSALSFITPADRGKWGAIDRLLNPNSKKESRSRKPSSRKPSRKRPSNAAPRGDVVQLRRDKKKKWSTSKPKKAA
jgi:superfamily II DNA/RNA helicase